MAFTDDNLERLKSMVMNCEAFYGMNTDVLPVRLSALLARLEAAERIVFLFDQFPTKEPLSDAKGLAFEQWRKACGK